MAQKAGKTNAADQSAAETEAADIPRAAPPADAPQNDSVTFSRCAGCANAKNVDLSAGTLTCSKFDMCINAEADEIPDDCVEYTPSAAEAPPQEPETPPK